MKREEEQRFALTKYGRRSACVDHGFFSKPLGFWISPSIHPTNWLLFKMGGQSREGENICFISMGMQTDLSPGGKVKPLKAAKKDKRDLDDEDIAFREKQKAGK